MTAKRRGGKYCLPDPGKVCYRTVDACEIVLGDPPLCRGCAKGREYVIDERRVLKFDKRAADKAFETLRRCLK